MKLKLTIFLILTNFLTYGQTRDSIFRKEINHIDKDGLRQGYWQIFKTKYISEKMPIIIMGNGEYLDPNMYHEILKPIVDTLKIILMEGEYKNDKKIGTWKYFHDLEKEKGVKEQGDIEKLITYLDNGKIIVENIQYNYKIEFNSDSTVINGKVLIDGDTVKINCQGNNCKFIINNEQEILSFTKDKFDYEFFRLLNGMYNREIQIRINDR